MQQIDERVLKVAKIIHYSIYRVKLPSRINSNKLNQILFYLDVAYFAQNLCLSTNQRYQKAGDFVVAEFFDEAIDYLIEQNLIYTRIITVVNQEVRSFICKSVPIIGFLNYDENYILNEQISIICLDDSLHHSPILNETAFNLAKINEVLDIESYAFGDFDDFNEHDVKFWSDQ